ncbi:hypothetical protein FXW07_12315 [Methanosarcina sp. DH1]|uniref:hypothetical protein n=1 Tax=Methanosarcina sp. DH1 TaxID=2605695 RepID=UPI001E516611|nr:hypothetical protein [Methanosarcina sp. DH1]MCC4767383.1 hypothetical protein [Methanosarcina sp. DH1]
MGPATHELKFNGEILQRGFWLYIWEITTQDQKNLYYVGRTGDSSSINAQSPFNRMGQHLGFNDKSNVLRRHLEGKGIDPAKCTFRLVAHGPILEEATTKEVHQKRRDILAALEMALAEAMAEAGYKVMNTVNCRKMLNIEQFNKIRNAFAAEFPKLVEGKK